MQQIIDLNLRKINKIVRKPHQFLVTIVDCCWKNRREAFEENFNENFTIKLNVRFTLKEQRAEDYNKNVKKLYKNQSVLIFSSKPIAISNRNCFIQQIFSRRISIKSHQQKKRNENSKRLKNIQVVSSENMQI